MTPHIITGIGRSITRIWSIATMNRTGIKIGLTAVLTLLRSVSQILADEDDAKDIIRLIGDGMGFSQVTATYVYETGHDRDLSAPLRY